MADDHETRYYFDFTEAYIGEFVIQGSTITIPIQKLVILGGFPGYPRTAYVKGCILIYDNVVRSERLVGEYATLERQEFKAEYVLSDGPFPETEREVFSHAVEGISKALNAYIGWEIIAASVRIENVVLDENQPSITQ